MKLNLLRNTACIAIISCTLGMGGCTTSQEDDYDVYPSPYTQQPACFDDNSLDCVLISDTESALYLPGLSEQSHTYTIHQNESETKTYYGSKNGTDLSSSAPAVSASVPVSLKSETTTTAVKIETVQPSPIPTPVVQESIEIVESQPTEEPKTETEVAEPQQVQQESLKLQKQTIQTKTVEVKEETTTATTIKDTSLATKTSYGEKCHDWEAKIGDTLRGLLMQWGEKSGWTVIWKLDRDYHLEAGVIFRGTFTEVSSALIRSFARATPAPIGTFYKGNRVLVISTQEDENAN